MKIGFNEATALECKGQSLIADLEACEKYGFDYIEIRFDCIKDYLKEHTLEELADWFKNHRLKPWAYNTLIFFNQRDEAGVKEIDEETEFIMEVSKAIGMKMLITVPSFDVKDKSVSEIKEEAVERLRYLSDKVGEDIKISLEFCGAPNCSINQFGTAYDVVKAVDRSNVGITVDTFHFHEMCSKLEDLKAADGNKIFAYHLNDCEDLPLGSCGDDKRLWPGEGVVDHEGIASALKDIGFDGVCTIEEFRPEYYEMSHDENVKKAAEVTREFVNKNFYKGGTLMTAYEETLHVNPEKNFEELNNEFAKVKLSEKLAYCVGDPALTVIYTLANTLLVYFYTNVIGLSAGIIGMIMLLSRGFDGVSDIIMGTIIDRTHSKYGKARVWILRLVVPYAIAAVLLMTVPNTTTSLQAIYVFITYNLLNTVMYTGISQPFHTLGSLMSRDKHERETISNIRMALSITASMVVTAWTLPIINWTADKINNTQLAWIIVTGVFAAISVFILLNTFRCCKERVAVAGKIEEKIPVFTALKLMVQNRYFLISLGLMLFYTVYQIILGIDLTYYCQYVMNDVNLVMPLSMAEKIPMIFIILLLPKLIPKYGKRNLIVSGCILGIVGQVMFLFNDTSVPLAIVSSVIRGIGMSPFYGVQYSLPSDAIEYGQWKTGKRIEGLMFSSMSFGQKFGAGITNAVLGAVLSMVGYNGMAKTAAQQAPAAISVIKFTYLYVPIIVWVVMMLITMCYKLDKTYKQMMAELSVRELSGKL